MCGSTDCTTAGPPTSGGAAGVGAGSPTKSGTTVGQKVGNEIAQFKSHAPAGKGTKFVDMDAVEEIKGPLRKSAPNLPKGFITSIYHTHTARSVSCRESGPADVFCWLMSSLPSLALRIVSCLACVCLPCSCVLTVLCRCMCSRLQSCECVAMLCRCQHLQGAEFLPDVPNVNIPKSLGVVMPRQILEDWSAIGFDPWSAGKQLRTTVLISDLTALERKTTTEEEERVSAAKVLGESVGTWVVVRVHSCLLLSGSGRVPTMPFRLRMVAGCRPSLVRDSACVYVMLLVSISGCCGAGCQLEAVAGAGAVGEAVFSHAPWKVHRDRGGTLQCGCCVVGVALVMIG